MIPERAPRPGQMCFHQTERERIVACGHRRMGGEDCRAPHFLNRLVERPPVFDHVADPLQHDERGVPFVEVPGGRRCSHSPQGTDAADAENDLLLNAGLAVAAVETG